MDSWATAFLVQEISGDHDTGIASQFSYTLTTDNPVLYAGPVWDFDGTMGNVNTAMYKSPAALTASIEQTRPEGNANQNRWLSAMYRNRDFEACVEEKYQSIFRGNLENLLSTGIDGYVEKIRRSAVLDALRWHEKRLEWQFALPKELAIPEGEDYGRFAALDSQVNMVREFLAGKKDFLDRLWVEHKDFCVIEGLPCYETEEYQFLGYKNQNGESIEDGSIIVGDDILHGEWEKRGTAEK